uniref:Large ribosomal subunit protein mL54 n=1 Tax=Leersia perrieri TaxID=77586 RepID=A0A0D9X8S2_9ORYZ
MFGANILKEVVVGLWHVLDKRPILSELRRKDAKTLPCEDLKRFVKVVNRARIKEHNNFTAKN